MKCLKCEIMWFDPYQKYQSNSCPFCHAELSNEKEIRKKFIAKGFDIKNGVLLRYVGEGGCVTIPDCVEVVGYGAFAYCRSLTEILLPSSVKSISSWTFYECNNLTKVSIFDSTTQIADSSILSQIGDSSFLKCTNLHDITIPATVTTIGSKAFSHCQKLPTHTVKLVKKINSNAI